MASGGFFLEDPEEVQRKEEIPLAMMTSILEDMTAHFLLHHKAWVQDGRTWYMLRQGSEERSRTDFQRWW